MNTQHSRASVYLLEFVLVTLILALVSSVIVQVYMRADSLADDARDLSQAVFTAQALAETCKAAGEPRAEWNYYDADWKSCAAQGANYRSRVVALGDEGGIWQARAEVWRGEELFYELQFSHYAPGEVRHD